MAIKWEEVKQLVQHDAVVTRYETEWDAKIKADATGGLTTTFIFQFKGPRPPHQDVVNELVAKYEAAGWRVVVTQPNMDGAVFGSITLSPP